MWKPKPTKIIGPLMDEIARQSMKSYPGLQFPAASPGAQRSAETLKTSGHPGSSPSRLSLAGHVAQGCWLDRSSATTAKFKRDQING